MPINPTNPWNDERETTLRVLWAQGLSARAIAATLRCFDHCIDGGRSAVIGKVHRLELPGRTVKRLKPGRARKRLLRPSTIAYTPKARKLPPPLPASPLPPPDVTDVARVSLLELESHHCRWPVGEPTQGFCGCQPFMGLPYCEPHARRAYTAPQVKPQHLRPSRAPALGLAKMKTLEEFVDA